MINDQNLPDHTVDQGGFVVAVTPLQSEPWDISLKNVVIGIAPSGWEFYRTSPHPLTGLKPSEIAYRQHTSVAMVSLYATQASTIPDHIYVTNCDSPLTALKKVLEIE